MKLKNVKLTLFEMEETNGPDDNEFKDDHDAFKPLKKSQGSDSKSRFKKFDRRKWLQSLTNHE